ncbi:amidase [Amycolatopsis sp. 195334CR]|uniref:allophanate hydrolase-related protein n=1 Tax=Amycolatopsis sp. 195334CR TaxID=2814588 RepID=UPI001A8C170E|nr:amidase [Amycolatopsis sp. 195334CR]MBN6037921.1 amidase [Amycolatopsis sp. 195334CR]
MNTLPPEPEPLPTAPPSAFQRVISAYERLAETDRANDWETLRSEEDVLVEAKAIDERVRAGEDLPLAGQLLAAGATTAIAGLPGDTGLAEVSAVAVQRLTQAGAVVLGRAGKASVPAVVVSGAADLGLETGIPHREAAFALRATPGLIPDVPVLYARELTLARQAMGTATAADAWPASFRLSAGEHPRVAVPGAAELAPLPVAVRRSFEAVVAAFAASGMRIRSFGERFDVQLTPFALDLAGPELPTVSVPLGEVGGEPFGITLATAAYEEQLALDLASLLTAAPAGEPYAATSVEFVVFGEQVRGRPLSAWLAELGARYAGDVVTASHYRMVLLAGPEAGVVPGAQALTGERWTISPDSFEQLRDGLGAPLRITTVRLENGVSLPAITCDPMAESTELTSYRDWRAYLRFLSTAKGKTA